MMMMNGRTDALLLIATLSLHYLPYVCSKGPPKILNQPEKRIVLEINSPLKLVCPVHKEPRTLFSWTKNGQPHWKQGWDIEADDKVLKLKHVSLEDRGVYECKATNGFGSVTVAFYVYIYQNNTQAPPTELEMDRFFEKIYMEEISYDPIIMKMDNKTLDYGESVTWFCDVYHHEKPRIQWYKRVDNDYEFLKRHSLNKNDTLSMEGHQYIPLTMLQRPTESSEFNTTYLEQEVIGQKLQTLYSNRLFIAQLTENTEGIYSCAVFTKSFFGYKLVHARITPSSKIVEYTYETEKQESMGTKSISIIVMSLVILGIVIAICVVMTKKIQQRRSNQKQDSQQKLRQLSNHAQVPQNQVQLLQQQNHSVALPPQQVFYHSQGVSLAAKPIFNQVKTSSSSPSTVAYTTNNQNLNNNVENGQVKPESFDKYKMTSPQATLVDFVQQPQVYPQIQQYFSNPQQQLYLYQQQQQLQQLQKQQQNSMSQQQEAAPKKSVFFPLPQAPPKQELYDCGEC